MKRSFLTVIVPALLVALGCIVVLRYIGDSAWISAAGARDGAFFWNDLLVVAAERAQSEFQAGIDC